jgi:nitrate/TMAO reductase-like tetraheme cytochrome c subunit
VPTADALSLGITLLAIVVALILFFNADRLAGIRAGRLAMLMGLGCLPLLAVCTGGSHAFTTSSSTEFCLSCHEMDDHGKSLFVNDLRALPAVHYQKRLIDRDRVCYQCHTDYAMFGDVKAKLNGLRHVWVHYIGEAPQQLELYRPYPNYNCLHCHDDARSYLEAVPHQGSFDALRAEEKSCLDCHNRGHALDGVRAGDFWVGAQ